MVSSHSLKSSMSTHSQSAERALVALLGHSPLIAGVRVAVAAAYWLRLGGSGRRVHAVVGRHVAHLVPAALVSVVAHVRVVDARAVLATELIALARHPSPTSHQSRRRRRLRPIRACIPSARRCTPSIRRTGTGRRPPSCSPLRVPLHDGRLVRVLAHPQVAAALPACAAPSPCASRQDPLTTSRRARPPATSRTRQVGDLRLGGVVQLIHHRRRGRAQFEVHRRLARRSLRPCSRQPNHSTQYPLHGLVAVG